MRKKPDLSSFKGTNIIKDPTAFLDDATADRAEHSTQERDKKEIHSATVAKLFRLSAEVAAKIKRDATEQSIAEGRRITEAEIVEQIFREFYQLS